MAQPAASSRSGATLGRLPQGRSQPPWEQRACREKKAPQACDVALAQSLPGCSHGGAPSSHRAGDHPCRLLRAPSTWPGSDQWDQDHSSHHGVPHSSSMGNLGSATPTRSLHSCRHQRRNRRVICRVDLLEINEGPGARAASRQGQCGACPEEGAFGRLGALRPRPGAARWHRRR